MDAEQIARDVDRFVPADVALRQSVDATQDLIQVAVLKASMTNMKNGG